MFSLVIDPDATCMETDRKQIQMKTLSYCPLEMVASYMYVCVLASEAANYLFLYLYFDYLLSTACQVTGKFGSFCLDQL